MSLDGQKKKKEEEEGTVGHLSDLLIQPATLPQLPHPRKGNERGDGPAVIRYIVYPAQVKEFSGCACRNARARVCVRVYICELCNVVCRHPS